MPPSFKGECHVGAGEDIPIDSHCAEDQQSNLEANDEYLTKGNAEEHNGEDARYMEIKGKKLCSCLQEQQRSAF